MGIVYQDYALFPHLTVMENIRYGLPYHKADRGACESRIGQLVVDLGIYHLVRRSVHHLSGGEKQRVALARALAVNTFRASVETMLDRGPYGEIGVTIEKQAFTVFVKKAQLQSICQPDTDNVWVTIAPQAIHLI